MLKIRKSPTDSELFEIYEDWPTPGKVDKRLWAIVHSDIVDHFVDRNGESVDILKFFELIDNRESLNIKLVVVEE